MKKECGSRGAGKRDKTKNDEKFTLLTLITTLHTMCIPPLSFHSQPLPLYLSLLHLLLAL